MTFHDPEKPRPKPKPGVTLVRLPDWLYGHLKRVYLTQARLRRVEAAKRLAAHDKGKCGGPAGGCRYYPCCSAWD